MWIVAYVARKKEDKQRKENTEHVATDLEYFPKSTRGRLQTNEHSGAASGPSE